MRMNAETIVVVNTQSLPLPIRERIHTKKVTVSRHGDGVVLLPVAEQRAIPKITRDELEKMRKGSITESLLGAVSHPPITAQEIREERLAANNGSTN